LGSTTQLSLKKISSFGLRAETTGIVIIEAGGGVVIENEAITPKSRLSKSLERSCQNSAEFHHP
jgi:hypothetical protein